MADESQIIIPPLLHALEVDAPANAGPGWRRWFNKYTVTIFLIVAGIGIWQTIAVLLPYEEKFCKTTVLVSNSGRADFTTISAAVEAMPPNLTRARYCIKITAGVYNESVVIPLEKVNLTLVGSGADKTILSSTDSTSATLVNRGNGFVALDLTIRNYEGGALENTGDYTVFYRCHLEGFPAVLSNTGKQFYRECRIQGRPYIAYGDARAVFQRCEVTATISSSQAEVAMVGNTRTTLLFNTGFVFHLCRFSTKYGNYTRATTTYLIGVETEYSTLVVMLSSVDGSIGGWVKNMNSIPTGAFLAVFQNNGLGATAPHSPMLHTIDSVAQASKFSVRVFLSWDTWLVGSSAPYAVDLDVVSN